jgi:hypothetical protein
MVIPEDEKTQEQKLEEEISSLKTRIKNTEYDLEHMFKGNDIIRQKLENTKKLHDEKQKILNGLTGGKDKTKEIRKLEENIAEKENVSISKEQEKMIEEEIESEFV